MPYRNSAATNQDFDAWLADNPWVNDGNWADPLYADQMRDLHRQQTNAPAPIPGLTPTTGANKDFYAYAEYNQPGFDPRNAQSAIQAIKNPAPIRSSGEAVDPWFSTQAAGPPTGGTPGGGPSAGSPTSPSAGSPSGGSDTTPLTNQWLERLDTMLNKDRSVTPQTPHIQAQTDAYRAEQERALRVWLDQQAERGGPYQNFAMRGDMARERMSQNVGGFAADLVARELEAERAELTQYMAMAGNYLTAAQARELQERISQLDRDLRAYQIEVDHDFRMLGW